MAIEFPTILYKCPGKNFGAPNQTYNWIPIAEKSDYEKAIGEGYYKTLQEAVQAFYYPVVDIDSQKEVNAFSREELEKRARQLGIKIHHKWSDKTLLSKIKEAKNGA